MFTLTLLTFGHWFLSIDSEEAARPAADCGLCHSGCQGDCMIKMNRYAWLARKEKQRQTRGKVDFRSDHVVLTSAIHWWKKDTIRPRSASNKSAEMLYQTSTVLSGLRCFNLHIQITMLHPNFKLHAFKKVQLRAAGEFLRIAATVS